MSNTQAVPSSHVVPDSLETSLATTPQQSMEHPGLSSLANEQDIGQDGGHIIHEEYEEVPTIPDPILSEERIQILVIPSSPLSSPEFPLREPGIPVVICSDTPTDDDYRPHSPTVSEYIVWSRNDQREYLSLPRSNSHVQRAHSATREAAAREELARLTAVNNEIERTNARNRIIADFYRCAACPRLVTESSADYWTRQQSSTEETSTINEADAEIRQEHPLHIARTSSSKDSLGSLSIRGWSNEPVFAQTNMTSLEREAMYTSIWCSRRAAILTEVTWMHSEEGQAWRLADPAEQEDILSYSADVQTTTIFNERYPRYAYPMPAPYQSRFIQTPLPKTPPHSPHKPSSRHRPTSPPIHHRTRSMYLGKGQVQAGSGGAEAGGSNQPPIDNPVPEDDDDSDIHVEEPDPDPSKNQGKKPEKDPSWHPGLGFFKGDRPPDRYADPVARNTERWSLPGAPDKFDPESDPPNPIGAMEEDAPWIGCKPDLIRKPLPFLGGPDDIDRFITDCQMYFQVHSAYMWLDPYRVAFASSYFEGKAKDWWTLQLAELYNRQKVKLYALRMTKGMPATEYFQELETLAKKARLRNDVDDRGHMVTALQQGVPASYITMIANIGVGIPVGYNQWKERIITMNEERQRKEAIDAIGGIYQPRPQQSKGVPSTGAPKTTSSATTIPTKKTPTGTIYGGRGQPMDIDAIKSGECFHCRQKGHISKNCPLQSWNKGKKQEVRASTTKSTDSKIEEVKDAAGK
ncbi:hypothetical protein ARMSODRAFT_969054 [Armillaria solidipes]|uniref:CCHC-type domain-containing protein n=1 Tax=Armillaria solidipes TaxID=1076256 RepID=A0A2H3C4S4_9AGAR|nr:hypothetical protein ARMSODRAFT_969054 [Armillaria solidipes]